MPLLVCLQQLFCGFIGVKVFKARNKGIYLIVAPISVAVYWLARERRKRKIESTLKRLSSARLSLVFPNSAEKGWLRFSFLSPKEPKKFSVPGLF